jgi:hypothetical protein
MTCPKVTIVMTARRAEISHSSIVSNHASRTALLPDA